jgi:predicted DCC family thiol-disulfide oxidoreductase YuxK
LRSRHPEIPEAIDTLVYVDVSSGEERVHLRSESILRVCSELGGGFRWLAWARILPRWFTDACYAAFVRIRYRLFGKLDTCALPTPEERERILE